MRRDLNEIENEILRRRDEYRVRKEKRERTARTLVPVLSGAALAVIAAIALPALLGRSPSMKPSADPSYAVSTAGPSVNLPGDIDSSAGSGSYGSDPGEPQAGETEPVSNGSYGITLGLPDLPGWYCGTPIVNDNFAAWQPGGEAPGEPSGALLLRRAEDGEREMFTLSGDEAAALFALIGELTPGEPRPEEVDKPLSFTADTFFGDARVNVVAFEDGMYLVNLRGYYEAPGDTAAALADFINGLH